MAVADRPSRVVVNIGGVLLHLKEELRRWGDPRSLDRIPDDRMTEISTENVPGGLEKGEAESRGHIPSRHLSGAEWKRNFDQVHAEGVKPDLRSNLSRGSLGPMLGNDQTMESGPRSRP